MVAKQSTKRKTTTTKKAPVKKSAPARATTKKVVAKATPVKKRTTAARKPAATSKKGKMVSFRVYRDATPFTNTSITRQTIYWAILLIVIVLMQLWILKIQVEIADLTNAILAQSI